MAAPLADDMSAMQVRINYRDIKMKLQDSESLFSGDNFEKLVQEANLLYSKTTTMRGRMADLECLRDMVHKLNAQAKNLKRKSGSTSTAGFISALRSKFMDSSSVAEGPVDPAAMDWIALGREATQFYNSALGLVTMLGPMDVEPRIRKIGVRSKKAKVGEASIPKQLTDESEEDAVKKETEANMETMFAILRKTKQVNFVNLVLNRGSFAQTVENIFAFSFLIKDGRAKLTKKGDKTLIAVPMNAPSESQRANGEARNAQFVLRLDFQDWQAMKQLTEPGKELMPNRVTNSTTGSGDHRVSQNGQGEVGKRPHEVANERQNERLDEGGLVVEDSDSDADVTVNVKREVVEKSRLRTRRKR